MNTLEAVLKDRAERGMGEILYEIYRAAYGHGAGLPDDAPHSDAMRQLIWLLSDRHRVEQPPPVLADELPGWLLRLSQQADTIEPPPIEGVAHRAAERPTSDE